LRIFYYHNNKTYRGKKYVLGELKATTIGSDWETFFNHLTMIGLQEGEKCRFKIVD
jgi:hypothetical protein